MPDRPAKLAILSALCRQPDFSALASFSSFNAHERRSLLHWLDQSGLALPFVHRLQRCGAASFIPDDLLDPLQQRLAKNVTRFCDMLVEFRRLNQSFRQHGVFAATLKGFSLAPDFCENLSLRHQTDFDFLVDPKSVPAAAAAFQSCGYSTGLPYRIPPNPVSPLRSVIFLQRQTTSIRRSAIVRPICTPPFGKTLRG